MMEEFYAGERLPWDPAVARSCLERMWGDPRYGRVFMASAGEPVGYGILAFGFSLEYGGVDAFVDELYVRPDHRVRGIGSALIDAMEAACRGAGVTALHLEVEHDNPGGRRLYRRRGCVDHERHLMTKRLPPPDAG